MAKRSFSQEYLALLGSFFLIGLEIVVRGITLALPISSPIAQASDFVELCELYGYYAEEHIVQTGDGYLLGLHRLGWRRGEEDQRVNGGPNSVQKKVAYLHHGLMMNSEVWVCLTEKERCLPFVLVEQGYDVWLGNNRGNKYSKKNVHHSPTEPAFWNYSIDQFAFHDIPDSIDYILSTTGQPSLSYIGFSQGTAQAFATLSIHPNLNDKVDVFIALAPAMAPPGLASGIVSSFIKASPEVLFLAFGRKAILSSTTMWQALLYPGIFCWVIDLSLRYLFGWHSKNITAYQKLAAYPHLFSFSSTKSVVHWLQIIRNGTFQMYDDEVQAPFSIATAAKYYKVAKFPTRNIKTPIVLVYGGSDSLVDIKVMLKELPKHTIAKEIPHYEHLDFLWASDVDKLVFPYVLDALSDYASGAHHQNGTKHLKDSISPAEPPSYSEDERAPKLLKAVNATDTDEADTEPARLERAFRSIILDFDARVPIPFSGNSCHLPSTRAHIKLIRPPVFPSSYRSDTVTESTEIKVDEQVNLSTSRVGREGTETRFPSKPEQGPRQDRRYQEEDVRVYEEDRYRRPARGEEKLRVFEEERFNGPRDTRVERDTRIEVERERYREPYQRYADAQIDVQDRSYDRRTYDRDNHITLQDNVQDNVDVTERDYRQRTTPFAEEYTSSRWQDKSTHPRNNLAEQDYSYSAPAQQEEVRAHSETRTTVDPPQKKHKLDMGYYDEDGHYHSFRHGLHRAADRILHPIHGPQHHHHRTDRVVEEDVVVEDREITMSAPRREPSRYAERGGVPNTITIPCHHIRIGDLLILQGRPCQVIRITTSAQTGQHRYLGVDLFTKQLHEESSFVSNPSPSVVVQNMLGPVFKQYRVLDIRDDGRVVAMTETGDVKQGLPVLDQSSLLGRLTDSFNDGRGSVRVLVINDEGRELAVDYKVIHGSRL
ncbi:hypothetical protein MBLNU459_g4972t1 [Dothideomycetes sp. NU459]